MEIEGYANYLIYEDGSVYSKKTKKFRKLSVHVEGYLKINLCKDGKAKHFLVHRLVAKHYIPNPHNYEQVDHIDRDKSNNHLYNLRWVNQSMNQQNRDVRSDNKLEIKNISPHSKSGYSFEKKINGKRHGKWFKTLEEAIEYKEHYLTN
jgi:hypothetical protein